MAQREECVHILLGVTGVTAVLDEAVLCMQVANRLAIFESADAPGIIGGHRAAHTARRFRVSSGRPRSTHGSRLWRDALQIAVHRADEDFTADAQQSTRRFLRHPNRRATQALVGTGAEFPDVRLDLPRLECPGGNRHPLLARDRELDTITRLAGEYFVAQRVANMDRLRQGTEDRRDRIHHAGFTDINDLRLTTVIVRPRGVRNGCVKSNIRHAVLVIHFSVVAEPKRGHGIGGEARRDAAAQPPQPVNQPARAHGGLDTIVGCVSGFFTRQGSWKDGLNVSRSARRLTIASALVAGLVGMTPLAQAQNAPQGAPPQAAPVQKAPAPNVPAPAVKAPAPAVPPQSAPAAAQAGTSVKRDGDVSRRGLAKFHHYLNRHPQVARELRK